MLLLALACSSGTPTPGPTVTGKDPGLQTTVEVVTEDPPDPPGTGTNGTGTGTTGTDPDTTGTTDTTGTDPDTTDTTGTDPDTTDTTDTTPVEDPCAATGGRLGVGDDHDVDIDDYTGDGETTEPKTDANDGNNGDNPEFVRHNVARGHCGGTSCYWYTSNHQETGEPDPGGEQWVDYTPDFADLGVGWYQITARYRQTDNRAAYPAEYTVSHRDGEDLTEVDQRDGTDDVSFDLGTYWMCPGSFVRVEDTGTDSITFNEMTFVYEGG